jgi:hypothetical protein
MSAFGSKADIEATKRNFNLRLAQKLRQLGDVRRDPPRLVFGKEPPHNASACILVPMLLTEIGRDGGQLIQRTFISKSL